MSTIEVNGQFPFRGRNPTLGWIWSMRVKLITMSLLNLGRNPTLGWIWSMRMVSTTH